MKYKVYRSFGNLDKDIKKHTLVAIEFGNDIYDATPDLIRAVTDEMANTPEFGENCEAWAYDPEQVSPYRKVKRYDYVMKGGAAPVGSEKNTIIEFGIIESSEEE